MLKLPSLRKPTAAQLEAKARMDDHERTNPRPLSPCVDQTETDIAKYYREAEIGSNAVMRHTQGGVLRYDLTVIDGRKPHLGRVYVGNGGAFYMKTGALCFYPKGQTSLVVPTEEVLAWIAEHPTGAVGVSVYRRL